MTLSEEKIQQLLEWFVNSSETRKKWSEPRRKALEENHKWIQPKVIQQMTDEELEAKFIEYYKTGGGRQSLNQINRDRIIRDKKRFKETLLYLLDEKVDIKERVDQILNLNGRYHIEGFGRAILTSFLMDYNPQKYCLWNAKTEEGFSVIGWKVYESKDSAGIRYQKVLDALQNLINLKPEFNLTFDDIDLFLHTISAEDEGKKAVARIVEGVEIPVPEAEPIKAEQAEFVMEKYLQDFIATNFSKINFGSPLELYQDEESNGVEYPAPPVGKIDLLAFDKEKNEFVVIELKKGKTTDTVVGQLLRYMGWVKENLAKGRNVRGIIISKERDEKLEYALKVVPNVDLFVYNISFTIERHSS